MKKKTKLKSLLSDFVTVLFCLGICGTSLFYFWKDLNKFSTRNDKNQIASIYFKHKIAQRKFNDRVVWERLSQNAPLYNEDTLRTADLAQAIIRFKDGTVLDLYENTMLQIFYDEEEGVKINVDGGDIRLDSSEGSSNVTLSSKGSSVVKLQAGSKLTAKINSESDVQNFEVQAGSASVISESGKEENFFAGESLNLEKDGAVSRRPVTVTSISKDLCLINVKDEALPVKLEWKTNNSDNEKSRVTVQTSRKKDFSEIESTFTTDDVSSLDMKAVEGTLYWRVFTEEAPESVVEGKVSVSKVNQIKQNFPQADQEFSYRENLPKISFSWTGNEYASRYKLEVSKTMDFLNPVFQEDINGTSYAVDNLSEGSYFWKVTPFYPLNDIGYAAGTETRSFEIVKNSEIKSPLLLVPANNSKIVIKDNKSSLFAWKSDINNCEYEITVSRDEAFSDVVLRENTKLTKINLELEKIKFPEGEYFWKILRKSGEKDDIYPVSEIRNFSINYYVPGINRLIFPPEGYQVEKDRLKETKFMWKLADEYAKKGEKSIVQISPKKDFSSGLKEFKISDSVMDNVSLDAGIYFWRIGIKDGEKQNFTEGRSFTVLNPLGTPEFIYPKNNQNLLSEKNSVTHFKWTSVTGADSYTLKLFDSEGNILNEKSGIKNETVALSVPKNASKVSVQAVCEETDINEARYGNVRAVSFTVRIPDRIILSEPYENVTVDGLSALRKPVTFSWKNGSDKPENVRFVLYKTLSSGSLKEIYSAKNPDSFVSVNRLTEGNYRWKIFASTSDGVPLDSETRSFKVLGVPVLPKAGLNSPENNSVIGPVYLKKYKSIIFDWQKVSGATDYSFALYQKNKDGKLKLIYSEKNYKNNVLKFKKLTDLDVGSFVWNVTAYSHARDGFEEQHGKTASGNFEISFDLPEQVKTIKPGRMYGE